MYNLVLPQTENQKPKDEQRRSREGEVSTLIFYYWLIFFTCHNKLFLYAFCKLSI